MDRKELRVGDEVLVKFKITNMTIDAVQGEKGYWAFISDIIKAEPFDYTKHCEYSDLEGCTLTIWERHSSCPHNECKYYVKPSAPECKCEKPENWSDQKECKKCGLPIREKEFDSSSFDAVVWAKEFMRLYARNYTRKDWIDEALMRGWFANAIMAGYDRAKQEKPRESRKIGLIDTNRLYPHDVVNKINEIIRRINE